MVKLEKLLNVAILLPGLAAVLHICILIYLVSPNCLTHDFEAIIPVVDKISTPGYNWTHFVADSTVGPHCLAPSILAHALVAHLTNWNAHLELIFGAFLIVLRCLVLSFCLPSLSVRLRCLFISVLLCLNFGTCCVSTLLFGNPSIAAGVGLLGFSLGLLAIVRLKPGVLSSFLLLAGGMFSAGFGKLPALITWFLYFASSILQGVRSRRVYGTLLLGVLLSALLVISMPYTPLEGHMQVRPSVFINILGRSFTNDIGVRAGPIKQSEIVFWLSLLFLAVTSFCHLKNRTSPKDLIVPFVLAAYGFIGALAVSLARESVMSWYSQFAVLYWSGILTSSILLLSVRRFFLVGLVPLLVAAGLYIQTNLDYKDKDFYVRTRSTVAEAVLRHSEMAPTYGESAVFATEVGDPQRPLNMTEPLRRRHWSLFAPEQVWRLQGEYVLALVHCTAAQDGRKPGWIADLNGTVARNFRDREHFDLLLPGGSSLRWEITLPPDTQSAQFVSTLTLPGASSGPADCLLQIETDGKVAREKNLTAGADVQHLSVDLSPYAGKKIFMVFSAPNSKKDSVWLEPRLEVKVASAAASPSAMPSYQPSNVDNSPYFPTFTDHDLLFNKDSKGQWELKALKAVGVPALSNYEATGEDFPCIHIDTLERPVLDGVLKYPLLSDFSHICVEIAQPATPDQSKEEGNLKRMYALQLVLDGDRIYQQIVPVLKDEGMHTYSYDLNLAGQPAGTKLTAIRLLPMYLKSIGTVQVKSVRLVGSTKN